VLAFFHEFVKHFVITMASSVSVSRQACGKIFLHAAKYFDSQLIGYVIGSDVNGQLVVSDVLSVCHTNPAGPILELAGDVVRHC